MHHASTIVSYTVTVETDHLCSAFEALDERDRRRVVEVVGVDSWLWVFDVPSVLVHANLGLYNA